jgi:hypothetical protein
MVLVSRHFSVPANEGHPGPHFGDGQPAGGRHAADGRLAPFRIVLNILGLLSRLSPRQRLRPAKVLKALCSKLNVVDDVPTKNST